MLRVILFFATTLSALNLFGQLHGTYTIGPLNSNFSNVSAAVAQLQLEGVSDTVTFRIRSGIYPGSLKFDMPIPNISSTSPVIFEPYDTNSLPVIIYAFESPTIKLFKQYYITFKNLTIKNYTNAYITYTIDILGSTDISFIDCSLSLNCDEISDSYRKSVLNLRLTADIPSSAGILIDHCTIGGNGNGIYLENFKDPVTVKNSLFNHAGKGSLSTLSIKKITISNNVMNGELDSEDTGSIEFHNNEAKRLVHLSRGRFTGNSFYESAYLTGSFVARNIFYEHADCQANSILDNTFHKILYAQQITKLYFVNNLCIENVVLSFTSEGLINANTFLQSFNFGFGDKSIVSNNLFRNETSISICDECKILNNNFGINSQFFFKNSDKAIVINNNFSKEIDLYNISNTTIDNNNYFLSGGKYDTNPYAIPPQYPDTINLRARNPVLYGKAISLLDVPKDIDNKSRSVISTIGANEICLGNIPINVFCGEQIILNLCDLPAAGKFNWYPDNQLDNPNIRNPRAIITDTIMYTVYDSISGFKDSIVFNPTLIENPIYDSIIYILCGESVTLSTFSHSQAQWLWKPATDLSSDTIRNPKPQTLTSTVFYVEMIVPDCPISFDSVLVDVNPLPRAYASVYTLSPGIIAFTNHSYCADLYLWDFGDGQASDEFEPVHSYTENGVYHISLIATNIFGSDTVIGSVFIDNLTSTLEPTETKIKIFPNPSNDVIYFNWINQFSFTLQLIEIFDTNGRLILSDRISNSANPYILKVSELENGIYICRLSSAKNGIIFKKIIIQK